MNTETELQRVVNTLEAGEVVRYHASPCVEKQTDAEHCHGVNLILLYLLGPEERLAQVGRLLIAGALHDSGELLAGDSPHFVKASNPALHKELEAIEARARERFMLRGIELLPPEEALLKLADCLEALQWCAKRSTHRPWTSVHGKTLLARFDDQYGALRDRFGDVITAKHWERADAFFILFRNAIAQLHAKWGCKP